MRSRTKTSCGRVAGRPARKTAKRPTLAQLVKKLDRYTDEHKINRSAARTKIIQAILAEPEHFTTPELLNRLNQVAPEVGRATLYRNLPILVASGIIQEGPAGPDGQALYELGDHGHHDHLVCLDCHAVFEFHDAAIERRQDSLASGLKFRPESHRHVIYARCQLFKT